MGYIENLKAQTEQAMKAKAFDDMQMQNAMQQVYHQGNTDAYALGKRDAVAELNGLLQGGLAYDAAVRPDATYQGLSQDTTPEQMGLAQRITK